ncbi:M50 family metallopeptidase [Endothiovibrio diazotrophicus]
MTSLENRPALHIVYLALVVLAVLAAWDTPVVYPLKLLVVWFHELSHAVATVATGGTVQQMVVNQMQGGHVISLGGNRFITLSAGYCGSLLIGAALYAITVQTRQDRVTTAVLGVMMIVVALLFVRNLFGLGFSLATAAALLAMARYLSDGINDFVLRVIGLTTMMYVPLDIFSDTIQRSHLHSDAYMMAEEIGGTTMMWGAVWLLISLAIIGLTLRWTIRSALLRAAAGHPSTNAQG